MQRVNIAMFFFSVPIKDLEIRVAGKPGTRGRLGATVVLIAEEKNAGPMPEMFVVFFLVFFSFLFFVFEHISSAHTAE